MTKQNDFQRKRRSILAVRESTDGPRTVEAFQQIVLEVSKKKTNLAQAIRAKRAERSLRKMAGELGESHVTLAHIENGRMPHPELFVKLVGWLDVLPTDSVEILKFYAKGQL